MKWSTLDSIVCSQLLNRGYTMHRYLQFLKYGADCLRELSMDDLKIINTVTLTLNSYNAVAIPPDCLDWIRIGMQNGQYVKPLMQTDGFNQQYNYQPNGLPAPWPAIAEGLSDLAYFGVPFLSYYVNQYNSRGENIGGLYGYRTDGSPFIFQVFPNRGSGGEIQFDSSLGITNCVVDYISDGRSVSGISMINTYAENCIERYIDWQMLENRRDISDNSKERLFNKYVGSRVVLRGRMNELTADDILSIWRNTYSATVKT
jgi:hypothetical protein